MDGSLLKKLDFLGFFKKTLKWNDGQNGKEDELKQWRNKKSMDKIETLLLERLPKRDIEIQGNHGNKKNNCVGNQSPMGSIF